MVQTHYSYCCSLHLVAEVPTGIANETTILKLIRYENAKMLLKNTFIFAQYHFSLILVYS